MWVIYAFGSAIFAGVTSILAKCGIRKTDSTVATAIRLLIFAENSLQREVHRRNIKRIGYVIIYKDAHRRRKDRTDRAAYKRTFPRRFNAVNYARRDDHAHAKNSVCEFPNAHGVGGEQVYRVFDYAHCRARNRRNQKRLQEAQHLIPEQKQSRYRT